MGSGIVKSQENSQKEVGGQCQKRKSPTFKKSTAKLPKKTSSQAHSGGGCLCGQYVG